MKKNIMNGFLKTLRRPVGYSVAVLSICLAGAVALEFRNVTSILYGKGGIQNRDQGASPDDSSPALSRTTTSAALAEAVADDKLNDKLYDRLSDRSNPFEQFVQISEAVMPSVVNIMTSKAVEVADQFGRGNPLDLWNFWFGMDPNGGGGPFGGAPGFGGPQKRMPRKSLPRGKSRDEENLVPFSLGSGFVYDVEGKFAYILTNNHVIDGADKVKVKFTEDKTEKPLAATIVGRDADLDVAVLKVDNGSHIKAAVMGDSDSVKVGSWVAALGNPFGHGHSIVHGILSAKERALPGGFGKYFQTDAPINPGNSGGPLVNMKGQVVAVNNAIDSRGPGIGFAIPINAVLESAKQLRKSGHVERGYLGVNVGALDEALVYQLGLPSKKGVIVTQVVEGEPADRAGVQPYDIITEVNGKPVGSAEELVQEVTAAKVGERAKLQIIREGKTKMIEVKLGLRPSKPEE